MKLQFPRVWFSLGIIFFLYCYICVFCDGCKKCHYTFHQRCYIFDPWLSFDKTLFGHYWCVYMLCGIFNFSLFGLFSTKLPTWTLYKDPNDMFRDFDVLLVVCRFHNLRFPFKIPCYLLPPLGCFLI
jgi:hypothetical protein